MYKPYPTQWGVLTSWRRKGRSLEEIDDVFADPHPVKASLRRQKVVVAKEK